MARTAPGIPWVENFAPYRICAFARETISPYPSVSPRRLPQAASRLLLRPLAPEHREVWVSEVLSAVLPLLGKEALVEEMRVQLDKFRGSHPPSLPQPVQMLETCEEGRTGGEDRPQAQVAVDLGVEAMGPPIGGRPFLHERIEMKIDEVVPGLEGVVAHQGVDDDPGVGVEVLDDGIDPEVYP